MAKKKKTTTMDDFKAVDTYSDSWKGSRDPDHPTSSIAFLYVDDLGEAPEGVLSPLVSFPAFAERIRVKKDDYFASRRFMSALKASLFTLSISAGTIFILHFLLGVPSGETESVLRETGIFIGIIVGLTFIFTFLLFSTEKYTQNLNEPEVHRVFKPILLADDSTTHYPRLLQGELSTLSSHYFYAGKENTHDMQDNGLYNAVDDYITATEEALSRGEDDVHSETLYTELAKLIIRHQKLKQSKKIVKNNDTVKDDMEEQFALIEEELDILRNSLMGKFNDARKYYDTLTESKLKEDAMQLLDL